MSSSWGFKARVPSYRDREDGGEGIRGGSDEVRFYLRNNLLYIIDDWYHRRASFAFLLSFVDHSSFVLRPCAPRGRQTCIVPVVLGRRYLVDV